MNHYTAGNRPAQGGERLSDCVSDIRERLTNALHLVDQVVPREPPPRRKAPASRSELSKLVRQTIKYRRNRDYYFESDLFADPAWDMLLELYAAELADRRMTVSWLCNGSAVPATTALRWIKLLEKRGMLERRPDPLDGRRVVIAMTPATSEKVEAYFQSVIGDAPLI